MRSFGITIKKSVLIVLLLAIAGSVWHCRKRTGVSVQVYNYALDEPVRGAVVVLVEKKGDAGGGIFSGNASCQEVAHTTTDENGYCSFDRERLRTGKKYTYFAAVKEAYGHSQSYPCGGKTSGFLDVGKSNTQTLNTSDYPAYFQVRYNNLLNPSVSGDSLIVAINTPLYMIPGEPYPFGGGGAFGAFPYYGCNGFPFASQILLNKTTTNAGNHVMRIRKRKLGVVSTYTETIKIQPYETKIIDINW